MVKTPRFFNSQSATRFELLLLAVLILPAIALNACGGGKKHADVRLLNVSRGYQSLDVYVNKNGDSSDTEFLQGIGYQSLASYSSLDSGKYEVKFKVHSNSSTLQDIGSVNFADETHTTYLAYGSTGNFGTLQIGEDVGDPDSGKSGIQLFNVAEAGSLDVYLTDASTALSDTTATFSGVGSGSSSSATLTKGTYRLRVTGAGDKSDLRLDVSSITLSDQKNYNIILTSSVGGVLVNALFLPQQGTLTEYANTNARIRAATGISDGNVVSVAVGGTSLLSNAAVGVISGTYSQITAGSAAVSLTVDSNPVTVANQTLTAGADYTLLVWSNADGNQTTLVSDDNHIPTTSGKLKLRVLNGMSALGDAVNFTAGFTTVASGVAVGQASTAQQFSSGSDYELDVTDSTNGATLLSKTSVSLAASDVYTLFISGGGTATVKGALIKDAGN